MNVEAYYAGPYNLDELTLGVAILETRPVSEEFGYWMAIHKTFEGEREIKVSNCTGQLGDDIVKYWAPTLPKQLTADVFKCLENTDGLYL